MFFTPTLVLNRKLEICLKAANAFHKERKKEKKRRKVVFPGSLLLFGLKKEQTFLAPSKALSKCNFQIFHSLKRGLGNPSALIEEGYFN